MHDQLKPKQVSFHTKHAASDTYNVITSLCPARVKA